MRTFTLAAIIAAATALRPTQRPNLAVARKAMANAVLAGAAIAGAAAAHADTLDPATSLVGELAGLKADVRAGKNTVKVTVLGMGPGWEVGGEDSHLCCSHNIYVLGLFSFVKAE